jgi:hypothetical protein
MTEQKRRAGRPQLLKNPVTQHVSLEQEQQKYCIAMDENGNVSAYIRKLIDQDMEKHNA